MLLSLQDAITPTHPTQGDTLGYKLLGFQPVNLLCLHRMVLSLQMVVCRQPYFCFNNEFIEFNSKFAT